VIPAHSLIDALNRAPADRLFITFWINEDEQETVTFGEFRRRALLQSERLAHEGVGAGDRLVIIMQQGIPAMTTFAAAMMIGAVPAFLAYPNFKVEPSKYRSVLPCTNEPETSAICVEKA
jgi:fatty-acyl-CoA synthase